MNGSASRSREKPSRRQQILESLAHMLEATPGGRITTAALAREVGVSEAALYRHFPSKTRMFEGLIEYMEQSLSSGFDEIRHENSDPASICRQSLHSLLVFCEANPGITRILTGDAISGEHERLREQVAALYGRLETILRRTLEDAETNGMLSPSAHADTTTGLLMALAEGKLIQFVRSNFHKRPTEHWDTHWGLLIQDVFKTPRIK